MTNAGKILVVRLSSLGDILHTLPAFQSLRATFPLARIGWLVERRLAFLLGVIEGIDEVIPIDTHAIRGHLHSVHAWKQLWQSIRILRAHHYETAIDFQGLLKTACLSLLSRAKVRTGFSQALVREYPAHWFYHRTLKRPPAPMHIVQLNLLLAQEAGALPGDPRVRIKARDEDAKQVEDRLRAEQLSGFVVINPGGGWPTKRWTPAGYGTLAERIEKELQLRVIVVTGPEEGALYRQITENCALRSLSHFPIPFLQLIPLFRAARLVIGGDTGPLHLACALRTPVVSIMGPTSPVRNGPWSALDEVVVRHLPCSFCNGRSCPTSNECMDISVDEVFAAVVRRLERTK